MPDIGDIQEKAYAASPTVTSNPDSVSTPGLEYREMEKEWELPEALMGGTKAMRAKRTTYLPQNPKETDSGYETRLGRTFLYNAYGRTVRSLASQPFIKPVSVANVPPELEYLEKDADSTGRSLTEICSEHLLNQIHYGISHNLVDHPEVEGELTLADQRRLNIRPFFNVVSPISLIYHDGRRLGGVDLIEEARFVDVTVERVHGEWTEEYVHRVRVLTPYLFETYLIDPPGEENTFELESSTANNLGNVPLVTVYGNKTGFMTGKPLLEDLAQLNLRHWQSSSEQNHILHVVRVPILVGAGFEDGQLDGLTIGANKAIVTDNPEASLKYTEHTGKAISSGRQDLKDLEEQMAAVGADVLYNKSVSRQTATARKIDKSESLSTLQQLVRNLERAIEKSYQIAGEWIGVDASEVQVSIGDDLSLPAEANATEDLERMFEKGYLSAEGYISELKRRGILAPSASDKIKPVEITTSDSGEEEPDDDENENESETEDTET